MIGRVTLVREILQKMSFGSDDDSCSSHSDLTVLLLLLHVLVIQVGYWQTKMMKSSPLKVSVTAWFEMKTAKRS
jgi:hypothetical protein